MRALAITGTVTASLMPSIISGSDRRATPPSRRMSDGTRSSAITATAPASSAIFAWAGSTTSMMTPPFNISASPRFTRVVPVSWLMGRGAASAMGRSYRWPRGTPKWVDLRGVGSGDDLGATGRREHHPRAARGELDVVTAGIGEARGRLEVKLAPVRLHHAVVPRAVPREDPRVPLAHELGLRDRDAELVGGVGGLVVDELDDDG